MKVNFRNHTPKRTYQGEELRPYQKYKPFLVKDFQSRCGYSDCPHIWFGGSRNFQIDHFKCLKDNPGLEFVYSNLIYSCSYINRAKSADQNEYLDPCDTDLNKHFYRDELGKIYPEVDSVVANYMWKKLQLYLQRYSIIWMLDNLKQRMELFADKIKVCPDGNEKNNLLIVQGELGTELIKYFNYLEAAL